MRHLTQQELDRSYDPREENCPVVTVAHLGQSVRLVLLDGSTLDDTVVYAAELPDSVHADTVRVRACPESEGEFVAVDLNGGWVQLRTALYAAPLLGETDAETVERLGLDETTLLPHPYGGDH